MNDETTIHKYLLCLLDQIEKYLRKSTDMELVTQQIQNGSCRILTDSH